MDLGLGARELSVEVGYVGTKAGSWFGLKGPSPSICGPGFKRRATYPALDGPRPESRVPRHGGQRLGYKPWVSGMVTEDLAMRHRGLGLGLCALAPNLIGPGHRHEHWGFRAQASRSLVKLPMCS